MSEIPGTNPKDTLSPENSKSIEILSYAGSADQFGSDIRDHKLVRFYFDVPSERNLVPGAAYPQEDFLKAVDFYCDNRDMKVNIALALRDPQGMVNVFYPNQRELVATQIPAFKVTQILEFAYQLARRDQKK